MSGALADLWRAARADGFDLADYPFSVSCLPADLKPESPLSIVFQRTPWPADILADVIETLHLGGGIFLLAADRAELIRMREVLELLVLPAAGGVT